MGEECVPRHNDYMGLEEAERFGVEIAIQKGYIMEQRGKA